MEVNKKILEHLMEKLTLSDDITVSDIPDIELYMDQMLTFLNNKLAPLKRGPEDKLLTKTMINNYTKDQLLIPPHNKKYTKEHIMLLILIYNLKNVIAINDIKQLFSPILQDMSTSEDDVIPLQEIFTTFSELKKDQLAEFSEHFAGKFDFISKKTSSIDGEANQNIANLFLTVLMLVAQANVSKRLAEILIDTYFTKQE